MVTFDVLSFSGCLGFDPVLLEYIKVINLLSPIKVISLQSDFFCVATGVLKEKKTFVSI